MANNSDFATYLELLKQKLEESGHVKPNILLVTCIDLRYPGVIHQQMETAAGGYFHKRYDQLALAGAGLAGVLDFPPDPKPAWSETFIEQVAISLKLHQIKAVVVLEHRTCGAYKEFGLLQDGYSADEERRVHAVQVAKVKKLLHLKYPGLTTDCFLLPEEPATDIPLEMLQV